MSVVLAVAVLHFIDGDAGELLARYRSPLAPGSAIAISHTSDDLDDPALAQTVRALGAAYASSATPVVLRNRQQVHDALDGLLGAELVEPGLVDITDWPEPRGVGPGCAYGAVARIGDPAAT